MSERPAAAIRKHTSSRRVLRLVLHTKSRFGKAPLPSVISDPCESVFIRG